MGEIAPHGLEGGVVVVAVGQERPHPFRQRDGRVFRQRDHPLQAHIPLGEGAGLIQAQHIHMGQALQGKQVLRQHPGSCQLGYPHRQTDGDQQHQPLGEHPQQAGGGGGHRVKHRRSPQEICLEKQEQPQRRDQEGGKAGHLPHGGQQLRVTGRCRPGLLGEPGGIVVRPHPLHLGHAGTGDDHTFGKQHLSRRFPHRDGLPSEQGLVCLNLAFQHQGIRRDLHPALQGDHVPQHQLLHRELPETAAPQGAGFGRGQHGDLLHQLFRMELLDDADDGVQGDDQDEQEVGPRPHQGQSDGDQNVEQIEQSTYMSADDLAGRFGDGGRRGVAASQLPQPFGLSLSQAVKGWIKCHIVSPPIGFFKESISLFLKQFINCG